MLVHAQRSPLLWRVPTQVFSPTQEGVQVKTSVWMGSECWSSWDRKWPHRSSFQRVCKTDLCSLWDLSGHAEVQVEHLGASRIRRLSLFSCSLGFGYWIPALCELLWSQMLLAWKWFLQALAQGETEATDSKLPKVTWGNGGNMGKKKSDLISSPMSNVWDDVAILNGIFVWVMKSSTLRKGKKMLRTKISFALMIQNVAFNS